MTATTQEIPSVFTPAQHAAALRRSHDSLIRTLDLLEPAELRAAHLPGGWTPTALLAHVAFWDQFQTDRMMAALAGPDAQAALLRPGAADNNARAAADAGRDWEEVLAQADAARQRLVDFAAALSPEILAAIYPEGERILSLNVLLTHMVKHAREHAQEVMDYCGSLARWGRDGMRRFLVQQHTHLMDAIGGMSEEWLVSERVVGAWTSRDVLAHVLAWEEFAWVVLQGWPDPDEKEMAHWLVAEEGEDDTNARLMAEKVDFNRVDLVDWLTTYHRRTLGAFDELSDEELQTKGNTGFGRDTVTGFLHSMSMHTAEHAAEIWRHRPDA